jgi:hypothetical protein
MLALRLLFGHAPRLFVRSACAGEPDRSGSPEEGRAQTGAAAFLLLLVQVLPQVSPPPDTETDRASFGVRDRRLLIGETIDISNNPGVRSSIQA